MLQGGYITWSQLQAVPLPDGSTQRVVTMAGIWNPADFAATLSIMTSKDGRTPIRFLRTVRSNTTMKPVPMAVGTANSDSQLNSGFP
jgi:hypothetical protein